MVDHSHLSAGNSESSLSRDLFAEFGVSVPSSPAMVESDAVPLHISFESDESMSTDGTREELQLVQHPLTQEVFRAASHFSQQDRCDAIAERRKNLDLMNFITAHGFSMQHLNDFIQQGTLVSREDLTGEAHLLAAKSPQRTLLPDLSRLPSSGHGPGESPSLPPSSPVEVIPSVPNAHFVPQGPPSQPLPPPI